MSLRPEPLGRSYDPPTAARHVHRLRQSLSATAYSYLQEENRILKAQLRGRRLCLTDIERRCLAALAYALCCKRLTEVATIATPATLLRRSRRRIAQKFDGSKHWRLFGRPCIPKEIEYLVVRMVEGNSA